MDQIIGKRCKNHSVFLAVVSKPGLLSYMLTGRLQLPPWLENFKKVHEVRQAPTESEA